MIPLYSTTAFTHMPMEVAAPAPATPQPKTNMKRMSREKLVRTDANEAMAGVIVSCGSHNTVFAYHSHMC